MAYSIRDNNHRRNIETYSLKVGDGQYKQRLDLKSRPRSRSLCTQYNNLAFVQEVDIDLEEEQRCDLPTRQRSVSFALVDEEPTRLIQNTYDHCPVNEMPDGYIELHRSLANGISSASNPNISSSSVRPALRRSSSDGSLSQFPLSLRRTNSVVSTTSTHPELTNEELLLAAVYVEDAVCGRDMQFREDAKSVKSYRLYHRPVCRWIMYMFIWVHLALALFEYPAIYGLDVEYWITMAIETVCLIAYICRFLHHKRFDVHENLWNNKRYLIVCILVALTWLDMVIYVIWYQFGFFGNHKAIRWSRPLRPVFLAAFGRHLRKAFENIKRSLPETLNVLAVFIFVVFMFSILAFKMFSASNLTYPDGSGYFVDFIDSMWDLYVLVTTANFPDVMMPAYDSNPLYAIFFISYIFICLYIFASIVLAVIYNNYKQNLKNDVKKSVLNKRKRLMKAFDILKVWRESRYIVNRARWHKLMKIVAPNRSELQRDLLLHVLDETGEMCLGRSEFLKVADILNIELSEIKDRSLLLERYCFRCYFSKPSKLVQKIIRHPYSRNAIGVIIILNSLVMVIEDKIPVISDALEWTFLGIFLVEIILKFYVFGCRRFFSRFWNIFDFVVVGAALVARLTNVILQTVGDTGDSQKALEFILILRILRLMKVMEGIERFRVVIITVMNIGPSILTYGGIMFIFYYFFAIIGVELFEGKVSFHGYNNITDPSQQFCGNPLLNGSDFYALRYCKNNFNDILHAMVMMFELTVVNQWHVITAGYVQVTSKAARLYFLAFHMINVIMILNIFVAFVLEAFILEYSLSNRELMSSIERKIEELGLNTDRIITPKAIVNMRRDSAVIRKNSISRPNNGSKPSKGSCHNLEILEPSQLGSVRKGSVEETKMEQLKFHLKKKSRKKMEVLLMNMFEKELSDSDFEDDPEQYEVAHPTQLSLETVV
ncbi:two pore calcium channel protein 1 isoform X2 [Lingula anatina]|uniref:Two pore calcium channel protein 1 isoform X2 n=1 Tax=Lingula anatina TaxID=7574 RepID=A0A1S3IN79_LINAN|nr:two pore calcium channel protein 1 isoform X2 [Lingula anatina]|eukprot:XP_013398994.1 two pore calcium channel protein 1 isoform X2 [Lingula anatina]